MKYFLSLRKKDILVKMINGSLVDLPSPSGLTYLWNYGSLLGLFLISQILTGLFLSFHFSGNVFLSFDSVVYMMRNVSYGWLFRVFHANGASMFFMLMYVHIGRGMYYGSYKYMSLWLSGVSILLLSMMTAFLGYVLPWGQMSYWAATVITNLLSAVPYLGIDLVEWIWGGFAVGNPTLIRFFAFHFLFPFVILGLVVLHLVFLHVHGSGNSVGLYSNMDKVGFHPYFLIKDIMGFVICLLVYMFICFLFPFVFMDVENFMASNPLITPVHIQPEWYFLFAYTILRSVPSSIGGVVALLMSVVLLYFLPFFLNFRYKGFVFYYLIKWIFWIFVVNWIMLTWIGACEVEDPYKILGIFFSVFYFLFFFLFWSMSYYQDVVLIWL